MTTSQNNDQRIASLSFKRVLTTWLPLVGSWLLMSIELPIITAIIARLPDSEINLAAYGSVAYTMAVAIAAPVIMLLAASTALSRDWISYKKLRKFTVILGGGLAMLHLIVAVTPIYDFVVNVLLQVPEEVVEPGRMGFICLVPWSFCIGYRRFQQGAMIRFGHSGMVWMTTITRLVTVAVVLTVGMILKTIPGTLLAGLAQGLGVCAEATYAGLRIRRVKHEIQAAPPIEKALTLKWFIRFYLPLALTSSLMLLWQPLISAAISRMPNALESLAIWSVITGLFLAFRSAGLAYNEAVVTLIEEPDAFKTLRRFTHIASLVVTVIIVLFVVTPLSDIWFSNIANLEPDKVVIAIVSLGLGIPLAFLSMYISFFQGIIVNQEKTSAVAEAVAFFLIGLSVVLVFGILSGAYMGIYVASAGYSIAHLAQTLWLMLRSRSKRKQLSIIAKNGLVGSGSSDQ